TAARLVRRQGSTRARPEALPMPACCTFARAALIGAASALLLATCREENPTMAPLAPHVPAAPSFATITNGQVLVGAGNIARCTSNADEATAKLLDAIPERCSRTATSPTTTARAISSRTATRQPGVVIRRAPARRRVR